MKEFWNIIMSKDTYSENFTHKERVIHGVVIPLALVAVALLASIVE